MKGRRYVRTVSGPQYAACGPWLDAQKRAEVQMESLGIKPSPAMRASFAILEALGYRVFIDFGYENAEAKALALSDYELRKVFIL